MKMKHTKKMSKQQPLLSKQQLQITTIQKKSQEKKCICHGSPDGNLRARMYL